MEAIIISLLKNHPGFGLLDLNSAKTALIGGKINDTCPCCGHQNMTLDTHGLFRRVKKCNCFRNSGGICACGVEEDKNDHIHVDNSHHHDKRVSNVCGCPGAQSQLTLYIHRDHLRYSCAHTSGNLKLDGTPL